MYTYLGHLKQADFIGNAILSNVFGKTFVDVFGIQNHAYSSPCANLYLMT